MKIEWNDNKNHFTVHEDGLGFSFGGPGRIQNHNTNKNVEESHIGFDFSPEWDTHVFHENDHLVVALKDGTSCVISYLYNTNGLTEVKINKILTATTEVKFNHILPATADVTATNSLPRPNFSENRGVSRDDTPKIFEQDQRV